MREKKSLTQIAAAWVVFPHTNLNMEHGTSKGLFFIALHISFSGRAEGRTTSEL